VLTLLAPDEPSYRQELSSTRAAIRRGLEESLQAGNNALKAGDIDRASTAFLRALALDPDNADAARALREIERRKLARTQADRASRARAEEARPPAQRSAPVNDASNGSYALEQALEMFSAGDTNGGLRDLHAWVDAHPQDRAARARVGTAVF